MNKLLTMVLLSFIISASAALTVGSLVSQRVEASENKYDQQLEEMKRKASAKGKAVYAVREIKEGAKIEAADIEEREIDNTKIPVDAITQSNLIQGRWAKKTIAAGSIVSQYSISFRDPQKKSKN